jgi:hypothetical protein
MPIVTRKTRNRPMTRGLTYPGTSSTAPTPLCVQVALSGKACSVYSMFAEAAGRPCSNARQARQVPTLILDYVLDNARAIPRDNLLRKYLPKDTVEFNDVIRDSSI